MWLLFEAHDAIVNRLHVAYGSFPVLMKQHCVLQVKYSDTSTRVQSRQRPPVAGSLLQHVAKLPATSLTGDG